METVALLHGRHEWAQRPGLQAPGQIKPNDTPLCTSLVADQRTAATILAPQSNGGAGTWAGNQTGGTAGGWRVGRQCSAGQVRERILTFSRLRVQSGPKAQNQPCGRGFCAP